MHCFLFCLQKHKNKTVKWARTPTDCVYCQRYSDCFPQNSGTIHCICLFACFRQSCICFLSEKYWSDVLIRAYILRWTVDLFTNLLRFTWIWNVCNFLKSCSFTLKQYASAGSQITNRSKFTRVNYDHWSLISKDFLAEVSRKLTKISDTNTVCGSPLFIWKDVYCWDTHSLQNGERLWGNHCQ